MGPVFFDLDGTLTDPVVGITRSIQHALEGVGVAPPPADELTWCIGPPLQETLKTLVGDAQAERALGLYRERFAQVGWQENTPYGGVTETLSELADAGLSMFVATSKPLVYAQQIVEHFQLSRYFGRVFGSELDGTRTRKADLLRFALARTGITDGATMIGDREHDVIGAKHNGMRAISVTYGYGTLAELARAAPDEFAHRPQDLVELLL